MFSRLTRLPLRRCLHTASHRPLPSRNRAGFTLGASAIVAATYLTWHLTSDRHRIALDSPTKLPPVKQAPSASLPDSLTNDAFSAEVKSEIEVTGKESSDHEQTTDTSKGTDAEGETKDTGTGGAYDPVTGEINWDCPCLGGMAHGPCGPEFREAFSCFIYSEEEPKGINCVEKFKGMQNCFREHPEVYGDEIMDDDEDESNPAAEGSIGSVNNTAHLPQETASDGISIPESTNSKAHQKSPAPSEDSS